MGPRSDERGNRLLADAEKAIRERLQWGRVQMNAETRSQRAVSKRAEWLQWGRVQMNAETRDAFRKWKERRGLASMGPRSDERGNVNRATHCLQSWQLQWGRVQMNAETLHS